MCRWDARVRFWTTTSKELGAADYTTSQCGTFVVPTLLVRISFSTCRKTPKLMSKTSSAKIRLIFQSAKYLRIFYCKFSKTSSMIKF